MKVYQAPTKEEVRIWLAEVIQSRKPPPTIILTQEQLWKCKNITS